MDTRTKILNIDNIDYVLYHGSCHDGFGSAFIIWHYYCQKFGKNRANQIQYIPCYYQSHKQLNINILTNKNVLMCDFSYEYNKLLDIINVTKSFMICDHHETSAEDLKNIPSHLKIFDNKRSAVGIIWDLFFPNVPIPKFLAHIQDRDIWSEKYPDTDAFVTFFYEQKLDFEEWLKYLDDNVLEESINKGSEWSEYKKLIIDKISKRSNCVIHEINSQYFIAAYAASSDFRSDIANKIFDHCPYADLSCVWNYNSSSNSTLFSLRSTDNRLNVAAIASKYGGGGHHNSASCKIEGMNDKLSFRTINAHGLIGMFHNCIRGKLKSGMKYALFNVRDINKTWFDIKYMELIKRKVSDCELIIFSYPCKKSPVGTRKYYVLYNIKSIKNLVSRISYEAYDNETKMITFTTTQSFEEIESSLNFQTQSVSSSDDENYLLGEQYTSDYEEENEESEEDTQYDGLNDDFTLDTDIYPVFIN